MMRVKRAIGLLLCLFLFVVGGLFGLSCRSDSSTKGGLPASPPSESRVQEGTSGEEVSVGDKAVERSGELSSPLERELGLPFYPGSEDTKESSRSAGGGYISVRTTRDSVEEVVRFYKSRLPHLDNEVVLPGSVTILAEHEGRKVFLLVTREGEITRITLNVSEKE